MKRIRECPKCEGEMVEGTGENLANNFGCTRSNPKQGEPSRTRVSSYYCRDCGYVEFYREKEAGGGVHHGQEV